MMSSCQGKTGRSYRDLCVFAVNGYIRRFIKANTDMIIPSEINQIISMFYLFDIEPKMIFDKESTDKAKRNGT